MTQNTSITTQIVTPEKALELLAEAWAYFTPVPKLVTERSSQPSPVFEEYYAA